MSTITWPSQFETTLRSYLPLLEPDAPVTPDLDLSASGLDSLATVTLLLDLEDTFGVVVPDDKLLPDTFRTAGALWQVVAALVEGG